MPEHHEERLEALETKVSYQDATIHDLNEVVCRQQKQIEHLEITAKHLLGRLKEMVEQHEEPGAHTVDERPPHY